jgi:hypothetical protein
LGLYEHQVHDCLGSTGLEAHTPETLSFPAHRLASRPRTKVLVGRVKMASAASACAQHILGFRRRAPLSRLPFPTPRAANRRRGVRMASSGELALPSTTVEVPGAAGPVLVEAAPGLPEEDFRSASVPSCVPPPCW